MSRYIITPSLELGNGTKNIFHLIPTEGIIAQTREIELPEGIMTVDLDSTKIKSKKDFNNLLIKLSKANFGKSKDGLVTFGSKVFDINFDDFVVDSCNYIFMEKYEHLYCLLRSNGITF